MDEDGSNPTRNVTPNSPTNACTFEVVAASRLTASTSSPRSLYRRYSASTVGISARHDPHQVTQKLRRTTLPRRSERRIGAPDSVGKVKSGAGKLAKRGGGPTGSIVAITHSRPRAWRENRTSAPT